MQYFDYLKKGDKLGVCAPSMGCGEQVYYKKRCDNAVVNFNKKGVSTVFSKHYFGNTFARSADAKTRAEEFEQMFLDDNINGIISVAGGEFMVEILPYINFNKLKKAKNKIFQGFSDNTTLTFLLTTLCDKATIYGSNFCSFGMKKPQAALLDNFNFLFGKNLIQKSYSKMESDHSFRNQPGHELDGFKFDLKTNPVCLTDIKNFSVKGRIIGGCLDVLTCICGTKFDKVKEFCNRYKDDGIIWYLESCDLNIPSQCRAIWQLKNAGWFSNAKAIIIGRALNQETMFDYTYFDANLEHLKDLKIPVVINADIGHTDPAWFIVNGSIANFNFNENKATLSFEFV
ncbi:MAG: LD-carboxypeptidase [Clostridia bacterium]|nr:LD-carboxypeptidase [Clostridia bacterium]